MKQLIAVSAVALTLAFAGAACAPVEGTGGSDGGSTSRPEESKTAKAKKAPSDKVVFKVWGNAPNGVDITYGSDGTNHSGKLKNGKFKKTLKLDESALYYSVTAQLRGGGAIKCSVKYQDTKKTGAASGGYNICSAQLNGGITGW